MEITTTIGCKVNCAYCPQDKLIRAYQSKGGIPKRMTLDNYKTILNKIPLSEVIAFSGFSEPWLNPQCTEMVFHTYNAGYEIAVFTTAVGMNKSDVEKIKTIPFKRFSLHLPDIEGYAKIKLDNDYLATIEAIVNAKFHNLDFMTMGTLSREVKKIIDNSISPTKMISRAGNLLGRSDIIIPPRLAGIIRCRSCGDFLNHNVVIPNGDVVLCCYDFGLQHILGNLITEDYNSLFTSETFQRLRLGLDDDSVDLLCRYCENASSIDDYERLGKSRMINLKNYFFKKVGSVLKGFK